MTDHGITCSRLASMPGMRLPAMDGLAGQCPGQWCDGVLLLVIENRAHSPQGLQARDDAMAHMFDCIERFCEPGDSTPGYLSPVGFEEQAEPGV